MRWRTKVRQVPKGMARNPDHQNVESHTDNVLAVFNAANGFGHRFMGRTVHHGCGAVTKFSDTIDMVCMVMRD